MFYNILLVSFVLAGAERREEGYPSGYLAVCPGSDEPLPICSARLNELQFVVEGGGRNYYPYDKAARGVPRDPQIDFKRRDTTIYVSGWYDFSTSPVSRLMGAALLNQNKNVLVLEANSFTAYQYPMAARYSRDVGYKAGEILAKMVPYGFDPKRTHVIGLSLGAHIMAFMASRFLNITGVSIKRLTGLDPAGPCFRNVDPSDRLNKYIADQVDVLHTNIDTYGIASYLGHVDFYINGGENQPNDFDTLPCTGMCSHARAYVYWILSLDRPNLFIGLKCESIQDARDGNCFGSKDTNVMGPNTDFSKPGIYYLATSSVFPYGLGKKGLEPKSEYWKAFTMKIARRAELGY